MLRNLYREMKRKYDPVYRGKVKARDLCEQHHERVHIISECICRGGKKEFHHPDYNDIYTVSLTCHKYHMSEHARLRSLATPVLEAVNQ